MTDSDLMARIEKLEYLAQKQANFDIHLHSWMDLVVKILADIYKMAQGKAKSLSDDTYKFFDFQIEQQKVTRLADSANDAVRDINAAVRLHHNAWNRRK